MCLLWTKTKPESWSFSRTPLQTRHQAFFRAELLLFKSPVSPYRSILWCHHVLAEKGNMGREQKEREGSAHAHTYTTLICRGSHGAIEAICSLPSTTHGQTKRSPTNCSACNPHPFPKPPHSHTRTHKNKHACKCVRIRARQPGQKGRGGTGPILVFSLLRSSPVAVSIQSAC